MFAEPSCSCPAANPHSEIRTPARAVGLHRVVASLAMRITGRSITDTVHQFHLTICMEHLTWGMDKDILKNRTKAFALRVMKLLDHLPRTTQGRVIADQLMRSATSVAANYRAVCRARSDAEFIAKLGTVLEEVDESAFWLELISEGNLLPSTRLESLRQEADELAAIFYATRRSVKRRNPK